jgi:acyl-homoserine lactone acylase PvdQ
MRSLSFPEAGRYLNAPRVHAEVLAQKGFIKPHGPARAFAAADKYNVAGLDERQACTVVAADRTMIRYRSRRPPDTELRARLRELAKSVRRIAANFGTLAWQVRFGKAVTFQMFSGFLSESFSSSGSTTSSASSRLPPPSTMQLYKMVCEL